MHYETINTTRRQRKVARKTAGLSVHDTVPVVAIKGWCLSPREVGHHPYWTTPSGKTIVHYPNAYGWPTLYHGSTRRVVVGELWLREHAPVTEREVVNAMGKQYQQN